MPTNPTRDELRIDLDPTPGVGFDEVRAAAHRGEGTARRTRDRARPKTTGTKGLHVYVRLQPRWDGYDVRPAAVALGARTRAAPTRHHHRCVVEGGAGHRVFVDFNQNAPHKTVFGAWSVRPRVGAQVSTPIGWDEVDVVTPTS